MDGKEVFNYILSKNLHPWARRYGFSKHGSNFAKWVGRNCQSITLSKGRILTLPSRDEVRFDYGFSLYAGVFYGALDEFVRTSRFSLGWGKQSLDDLSPKYPSVGQCHWWVDSRKLTREVSPRQNYQGQWVLTGDQDIEPVTKEVVSILETRGLPMLERYSDEARLVELWKSNEPTLINSNFVEFMRMKYVAVFLADSGRMTDLEQLLLEFRVLFGGGVAKEHVEEFMNKVREHGRARSKA